MFIYRIELENYEGGYKLNCTITKKTQKRVLKNYGQKQKISLNLILMMKMKVIIMAFHSLTPLIMNIPLSSL